jgi:hypothetical protein
MAAALFFEAPLKFDPHRQKEDILFDVDYIID